MSADCQNMRSERDPKHRPPSTVQRLRELAERERRRLTSEILEVRGLMPLLMKPRNSGRWTDEDKKELVGHLRRLSSISRYLVVFALPGGVLMLPVLAWWIDRRSERNRGGPSTPR